MRKWIKRCVTKLWVCAFMCSFLLLSSAGPSLAYVATGGDSAFNTPVEIPSADLTDTAPSQDSASTSAEESETDTPTKPEPPAGQATVVENVTGSGGREFFTIQTQDENTFYLVVDRESESENVYFLDTVKESDLLSLAEKDDESGTTGESAIPDPEPVCICIDKCVAGEVNTDCPVCILSLKDCTGTAPAVDPDAETTTDKTEKGNSGTIILIVVAALAAGGAGYYIKIYKPKKDLDDAEDFDELTGEDEVEEETVNDDAEDDVPNYVPYEEPDEPDYPEGYGYEEPEDDE